MDKARILVPTDFSDLSKKAFSVAEEMASILNGTVTPFHSYIPITDLDGFHYMSSGSQTQKNLSDIEVSLTTRLNDLAGRYIHETRLDNGLIGIGNPAHAIVETSEDYDLIVLSTHGRTGFKRFLLGSVAEKVLRMSAVPVMIVEDKTEFAPLTRILVPTDFSENAKAAYPHAARIAEITGADVDLFHAVIYDNFDSLAKAESTYDMRQEGLNTIAKTYFNNLPGKVTPKVIMSNRSAHEAILKRTQEQFYNLIVISTIGRTGLDYMMLGSTTSQVARHVKCAVLSINPDAATKMKKEAIENEKSD
ncbi:MAG: universal stress protein [Balneolales bacterium]|nr:universal stress protein [Balneolales bacterium]